MSKLRIALIGREAGQYASVFSEEDCRVVQELSEIKKEDDLVFCLSFPKIIPDAVLKIPRHGVWVNHSSDLPLGRGWAPLQWSVIKGLSEVTVTLFKATVGCDAGPWAFKQSFAIDPADTIETLYRKDFEVSSQLYRRLIESLESGSLTLHEQIGQVSHWPRRTPADSELDASIPLAQLWDQIRICDNQDYPAFFMLGEYKITLRYEVERLPTDRFKQ